MSNTKEGNNEETVEQNRPKIQKTNSKMSDVNHTISVIMLNIN